MYSGDDTVEEVQRYAGIAVHYCHQEVCSGIAEGFRTGRGVEEGKRLFSCRAHGEVSSQKPFYFSFQSSRVN